LPATKNEDCRGKDFLPCGFKLYFAARNTYKRCVLKGNAFFWSVIGLAAIGLMFTLAFYLPAEARLRRRRRKSHNKIISKSRKPIVRFSVRPPKDK
jgi:hypothetical protein